MVDIILAKGITMVMADIILATVVIIRVMAITMAMAHMSLVMGIIMAMAHISLVMVIIMAMAATIHKSIAILMKDDYFDKVQWLSLRQPFFRTIIEKLTLLQKGYYF